MEKEGCSLVLCSSLRQSLLLSIEEIVHRCNQAFSMVSILQVSEKLVLLEQELQLAGNTAAILFGVPEGRSEQQWYQHLQCQTAIVAAGTWEQSSRAAAGRSTDTAPMGLCIIQQEGGRRRLQESTARCDAVTLGWVAPISEMFKCISMNGFRVNGKRPVVGCLLYILTSNLVSLQYQLPQGRNVATEAQ